jgi:predicted O-methyltransferase YrrM
MIEATSAHRPEPRGSVLKASGKRVLRWTYRYQVGYIRSRLELPHILNARGLCGEGAEIGVQTGMFSEMLLRAWGGRRLYSIDPWREFTTPGYVDVANAAQAEHERLYGETCARLQPYGSRSSILRQTSEEAASRFPDGALDFVYIDAQHHYEAVRRDLELWYPRVARGGVLAGHDYLDGEIEGTGIFGVKRAVDEFARECGIRVVVTRERWWPSWFMFLR